LPSASKSVNKTTSFDLEATSSTTAYKGFFKVRIFAIPKLSRERLSLRPSTTTSRFLPLISSSSS